MLTRSFFLGSQKFGAYWTGDNYTEDVEVFGAVKMIIQNGISGAIFGGADIPGFIGNFLKKCGSECTRLVDTR